MVTSCNLRILISDITATIIPNYTGTTAEIFPRHFLTAITAVWSNSHGVGVSTNNSIGHK